MKVKKIIFAVTAILIMGYIDVYIRAVWIWRDNLGDFFNSINGAFIVNPIKK